MDSATKYELISKIIETDNDEVLQNVKRLLDIDAKYDFWHELSLEDQEAINEGLDQLDKGEFLGRKEANSKLKADLGL